jgi:hypothetical protein
LKRFLWMLFAVQKMGALGHEKQIFNRSKFPKRLANGFFQTTIFLQLWRMLQSQRFIPCWTRRTQSVRKSTPPWPVSLASNNIIQCVHAVLSLSRLPPNFIDVPFWAGRKSLLDHVGARCRTHLFSHYFDSLFLYHALCPNNEKTIQPRILTKS